MGIDMSVSIKSEDDVVVYLGKKFKSYYIKVYPQVDIIARNIMVSPDIDLLVIDENNKKTIGYEVKLLTYRKQWKRFNYEAIYRGIGQALLYRLYGIAEAFLVIAYHINDTIPKNGQTKLAKKIVDVSNSLIFTHADNFLGLCSLEIKLKQAGYKEIVPINKIYLDKPKDFDYRKNCILKNEFSYNKNLYKIIYET